MIDKLERNDSHEGSLRRLGDLPARQDRRPRRRRRRAAARARQHGVADGHAGARLSGGDGRARGGERSLRRSTICSAARRACSPRRSAASICSSSTRRISIDRQGNPYLRTDGRTGPTTRSASRALGVGRRGYRLRPVAGFVPDIVHAHDWQAGLAPAYLHYGGGRARATVMTVHNLAFQGQFPADLLGPLGCRRRPSRIDGVEYYGASAFSRPGCSSPTASPRCRRPMRGRSRPPPAGMGLDGLAARSRRRLVRHLQRHRRGRSGIRRPTPASPRAYGRSSLRRACAQQGGAAAALRPAGTIRSALAVRRGQPARLAEGDRPAGRLRFPR